MSNPYDTDRHPFINYDDLVEAAGQVSERLEQQHVALVGGFALQLMGSPRLTGDLDLVGEPPSSMPVLGTLSFGGVKSQAPNGVPVDFIVRADAYRKLYERALDNTMRVADLPLPVVAPHYIAAMKMAANRLKDRADLEWMIASGRLDVKAAGNVITEYLGPFAAGEFDALVRETLWKKEKGLL